MTNVTHSKMSFLETFFVLDCNTSYLFLKTFFISDFKHLKMFFVFGFYFSKTFLISDFYMPLTFLYMFHFVHVSSCTCFSLYMFQFVHVSLCTPCFSLTLSLLNSSDSLKNLWKNGLQNGSLPFGSVNF